MTDTNLDPFEGVPVNGGYGDNVTPLDFNAIPTVNAPERLGSAPAMLEYPIEALGPYLADKAKHIQGMTGADPRLVCQSLLAHVNLTVQGLANVRRDAGSSLPISLAMLSIARSGDSKSECDKHIGRAFGIVESEAWDDYQAELADWQLDNDCFDRDRAEVLKAKGAVKRNEAKANLGDRPVRPLSPIRRIDTATAEALVSKLQTSFPSRGLFSDEAATFLGGYSAREAKTAMLGTLTKLWDGQGVTSETKGEDGTTRIPGRRFAIHLQGQPEIMNPFLMDRLATGQGLLPRCLWVGPKTTLGVVRTPNATQLQVRDDLTETMARLLRAGLETYREGSDRILEPPALDLSDEARALSLAYTNEMRIAANDGHEFAEVRGYAVRSGEQALRIMATLALFNRYAAGTPLFESLTADEARRGVDLARFYLNEVKRLRAEQMGDISERLATDWLAKIVRQFADGTFTKSDAYRFAPNRLRPNGSAVNRDAVKAEREDIWSLLLQTRNVLSCGPQEVDGVKRTETFTVNRESEVSHD
ncbi:hypothetical protein GCM10007853_30080 [Algimonas ampicilliniresistens]|uniref:DUF3987 domain-containing protein n=1 Tax=Algimonas ampicilliniresistens TaxID=1298735 RepID=A0ABQ5VDM1_9PROT|nr:DUF3987 domain-containing protein [Algimonas ampicilliniresistens]GLQ25134.1 hypothetical protein GCM10007853_30080 [Algimonas ampicilliniresistens]